MAGSPNNTFFDSEPGGRKAAPGPLALVQAFVNTLEAERRWEVLDGPDALRRWFAGRGIPVGGQVNEADVEHAREVREALRALLAANNGAGVDEGVIRTLNLASRRAGLTVAFGVDGRATLEPAAGGVDGALGWVLASVHAAMEDGTWGRLKTCRHRVCSWAFYDHSKNRSGRWCSMTLCGNRKKTRDYRQRRRPA